MRILVLAVTLIAGAFAQDRIDWQQVFDSRVKPVRNVPLSAARRRNLEQHLRSRFARDIPDCAGLGREHDGIETATVTTVPVSPVYDVFLVEIGQGCARSGPGPNGAMWLVRFDGGAPPCRQGPQVLG